MLRERKVDLLVLESSVINDEEAELVVTLPPVNGQIFVRAGHPLLQRFRPELAEILEFPFVQVNMLPPRILQQVLPFLRSGKAPPSRPFPAVVCPTVRMALDVISGSDAFMFGNVSVLKEECASGRIVPLEVQAPWLYVSFGIFRLRLRDPSPEMVAAIDVVKTAYAELFGFVDASVPGAGD
jgi:DNA-binding transcriptional LysR family regulator